MLHRPSAPGRRSERGYNLIEVLIAIAILGTVLMSIITLFFMGRRNVYSGKQLTRATAVATHVAEDLSPMSADEMWTAFNIVTTTPLTSPTIGGTAYKDVIVRSTSNIVTGSGSTATDPKGYLTRWNKQIPTTAVESGKVTVVLIPTQLATANDPTSARVIRVRIITEWNEARRPRQVTLDTIKLNRV
jgi:prepilin-type N-terminal cleavage/methylation domain-containing protein